MTNFNFNGWTCELAFGVWILTPPWSRCAAKTLAGTADDVRAWIDSNPTPQSGPVYNWDRPARADGNLYPTNLQPTTREA